jgi:serine phosphatase RsbU (regulator of sigma subunit)
MAQIHRGAPKWSWRYAWFFSDGVTEAVNPADEDFGETRLAELVASLQDRPARET